MGKNRQEDGHTPKAALRESLLNTFRPNGESGGRFRKKVLAAVVATGALAAVGQPMVANANSGESNQAVRPAAERHNVNNQKAAPDKAAVQQVALKAPAPAPAAAPAPAPAPAAAPAPAPAAAPAPAPEYVKPADGSLSSGYGSRSGSSHKGVDVANSIGTPIHSVASGKVISAGPATGFGQWVRVQHDNGAITVYGHINTIDVDNGQRVEAGEQIATLGNKGKSTGPHLHFEVIENGSKINPMPWLTERGIGIE